MSSSGGAGPDPLLALAQRWSVAGALAGGVLILAAAVLVSVDVTLRKLANVTLGGADELSGYALAIGSTWSFAFVLLNRGNVRIDALYQRLPRAGAALCDVLAVVALLAFGGVVAWYGWGVVAQALGHWVARDWDALNGLVGARSVADEAEEELANALAAAQSAQRGASR